MDRRKFINGAAALGLGATTMGFGTHNELTKPIGTSGKIKHNPIGVSTYSFWKFEGPKENVSMGILYR